MKPILFNTNMVRAILDERKMVTRRPVKPQPQKVYYDGQIHDDDGLYVIIENQSGGLEQRVLPYHPGDILYVREAWQYMGAVSADSRIADRYIYKADWSGEKPIAWRPSIHMPREAARLFLRVTDVRVERLQDMTEADAVAEGFEAIKCDHPGGYPCTDCMNTGYLEPAMLGFVETWNSTIKPTDCALYGWDTNPWVWVIEFEKIRKEEALRDA